MMTKEDWSAVGVTVLFVFTGVGIAMWFQYMSGPTDVWDLPQVRFVSGTEYVGGETGQVIVEARFLNGSSALGAPCNFTIWWPDKNLFLTAQGNTSTTGNQYTEFLVPNTTGIYEYRAECALVTNYTSMVSKAFHVSAFQNDTMTKLNRVRAVIEG